ncbi:MAG: right-handed parallel beta-helix repeat-containing protein [Gammaproteobacteria bacterium]|nr:right-handed parallel beta-helix repeat-containing protein [Gammaproteobacteria bacterium]
MNKGARIAVAFGLPLLLGLLAVIGRPRHSSEIPKLIVAGPAGLNVNVTSPDDIGPGTLREALFVVAAANGQANVVIKTPRIVLRTALPPLLNSHGVRIVSDPPGAEIDAQALTSGPVFDVTGANASLAGLVLRNCPAAAVQLRSAHFHLQSTTVESCDVGVDVAANASDVLIENNRFANDRIGVRFAAPSGTAVVTGNSFIGARGAGLWAVRAAADAGSPAINVRQNHFTANHAGVVAGNIAIVIERNDFTANAPDAAVHVVGAGAVIHGNHVSGAATMGVVAENARGVSIDDNDFNQLSAYAIMLRDSPDALVRGNRVIGCGYGIAFVLGEAGHPGTATDNTIVEPAYHGIDVIGDSPILRHNQVLRPHGYALHVLDFSAAGRQTVRAQPVLEGNNFRADTLQVASDPVAGKELARGE